MSTVNCACRPSLAPGSSGRASGEVPVGSSDSWCTTSARRRVRRSGRGAPLQEYHVPRLERSTSVPIAERAAVAHHQVTLPCPGTARSAAPALDGHPTIRTMSRSRPVPECNVERLCERRCDALRGADHAVSSFAQHPAGLITNSDR